MKEAKLLSEVKQTTERVIAISLHNPDKAGLKGTVVDYDDIYVEFLTDFGKREMLPISAYKFRRISKEARR